VLRKNRKQAQPDFAKSFLCTEPGICHCPEAWKLGEAGLATNTAWFYQNKSQVKVLQPQQILGRPG